MSLDGPETGSGLRRGSVRSIGGDDRSAPQGGIANAESATDGARPAPGGGQGDAQVICRTWARLRQIRPAHRLVTGDVPEDLSAEFRSLLDQVPPADPQTIRSMLSNELGASPENVFGSFDEVPFASASIAQVHRATLKDGTAVVVKIQRPRSAPASRPTCRFSNRSPGVSN